MDFRRYEAMDLTKYDSYVLTCRGHNKLRNTTSGCQLLICWKDGFTQCIHSKYMKESHPVELADFTKVQGTADEPEFSWWVTYTLLK